LAQQVPTPELTLHFLMLSEQGMWQKNVMLHCRRVFAVSFTNRFCPHVHYEGL